MIEFSDKSAQRVFEQYQKQIEGVARHLTDEDKNELKMEIASHLHESMSRDVEEKEIDKLLNAIDKLGPLEEYLQPIVADKLIDNAGKSLSPKAIFRATAYNFGRSAKRTVLVSFFGLIYIFVISLFIAGILKFFIPEIGLYVGSGNFVVGMIDRPDVQEVLGYWITPIAFVLAGVLYVSSAKIMRLLAIRK